MGKVDVVAFDKTGTMTYGRMEVSDVVPYGSLDGNELLLLASSAEERSEHPLGKAIAASAKERGMDLLPSSSFTMEAGKGVSAVVAGRSVRCGNMKYITDGGVIVPPETADVLSRLGAEGKALVLVSVGGTFSGVIALSDVIRENAPEIVSKLKDAGAEAVLLTGDNERAASHFASLLGIASFRSELLPGDKVEEIERMERDGHFVCMVGDGVNDAPALKKADVGVAMGMMGSDIAMDASDIALMSDDLSRLPYLKRLSVATVGTIRLSITLSMTINLIAVTLSVLGLLNPTTGALVHNAGSCFVVLIAALLYDRKFD